MQKKIATSLLLFIVCINCYSQKKEKIILKAKTTLVRLNLTSLIDPIETNFSMGVEHRFKDDWSVSMDLGYVLFSSYYENVEKTTGIIVRPAVRYYLGNLKRDFIEAEINYKRVVNTITDWLGKQCVNEVPTYYENQQFRLAKYTYGFNLKYGRQGSLSKNGKLWIEPYTGIGFRMRRDKVLDEANSCFNLRGLLGRLRIIQADRLLFTIPLGFRILYKL